ncbi:MAG: glycosyltransferase [Muribaculaceae bacterium]|nr:glycosyltransferase [Muribaculaceae bacterium]
MKPKISVIIPNYNHAPYLRERIDSVLNQTYDDFEIILLDDCSTDNSREIIESYRSEPRVSEIVYNEVNSGTTFAQWRKGLSLARGKYVWIAESDDSADPDFLKILVSLLDDNPDAVLAFAGSKIIDSLGNEIPGKDWDKYGSHDGETVKYTGYELLGRRLLRNNLLYNASMILFRRDAAPEITNLYTSMKFCGDWLFWSRLAAKGEAIEVCRKLNRFRQHNHKVSNTASREGLTYTEGLAVVAEMTDTLHLTPTQRKVIAGRICKRLRKFPGLLDSTPQLRKALCEFIGSQRLYPPLLAATYEADKLLHFSGLPPQARK